MMNSRWQANKIGLINFWYYDEQEFPFVKGRMLLRGSNGSGKSVTMQSVVPLLLDGNMSPERLDPFGSRDRKMSSYLLEEDDGREERTGYLYLELKRQNSDTYLTIGMGIRARRGKNLDKWYFSLTDGRRIGKDFFLYKDSGEKVTLSKKELENKIATFTGGRAAEEVVFGEVTTGASNDIEQATKIARSMITRYGMSDDFDMVAMETVTNQYLGGDASLACSADTQNEIDRQVVELVKREHEKAKKILMDNRQKLDELSNYLYEKETITGDEFMAILKGNEEKIEAKEDKDYEKTV